MKPSKYKIFFFFFFSVKVFSQNFLGASSGNYSGTNALPLNPADVVDGRYLLFMHVGGVGLDLQNNYARWSAPFSFVTMATGTYDDKYRTSPGGPLKWMNSYAGVNQNRKNIRMILNVEGRGPAIQYNNQKHKTGIAMGVRYRLMTSLNNTSEPVGEAIVTSLKSPNYTTNPSTGNAFTLNNGLYNEYFITIGKVLKDEDEGFFKGGVTLKRFVSDFATNVTGTDIDYLLSRTPSNWKPGMMRTTIDLPKTEGSFSNVTAGSLGLSSLTKINGLGTGFGLDLGLIYEFRPDGRKYEFTHNGQRVSDPTKNKYKYRIGFSIVDIGYLRYSDPGMVNVANVSSTNDRIEPDDFYKLKGTDGFIRSIENVYSLDPTTYQHSYTVLFPATTILSFDYAYSEKIYIHTIWRQSVLPGNRRGPIGHSGISVIPRYERKYFEFSAPISLDNNYSNLNIGLAVRAGGLYLGSDNALGIFNVGNPRGISVYAGLFLPIYARLPKSPLKCYYDENYKIKGYRKKKLSFFRKV